MMALARHLRLLYVSRMSWSPEDIPEELVRRIRDLLQSQARYNGGLPQYLWDRVRAEIAPTFQESNSSPVYQDVLALQVDDILENVSSLELWSRACSLRERIDPTELDADRDLLLMVVRPLQIRHWLAAADIITSRVRISMAFDRSLRTHGRDDDIPDPEFQNSLARFVLVAFQGMQFPDTFWRDVFRHVMPIWPHDTLATKYSDSLEQDPFAETLSRPLERVVAMRVRYHGLKASPTGLLSEARVLEREFANITSQAEDTDFLAAKHHLNSLIEDLRFQLRGGAKGH